jgi:ParB family transcriptional regulator, chromosome partitioning protein
MGSLMSVDPWRCRVWSLHDRLQDYLSEKNCAREIKGFEAHGQHTRVLARPVRDDPDHDLEVICGTRRLFVARLLKIPLLVEVRELTDTDAIIAIHVDSLRKNTSPYERGLSYLEWIRAGYFNTQEELAATLKVHPSEVSRPIKLARLPCAIVQAFGNPTEIRECWGKKLTEVLADPMRKAPALRAARALAARPSRLPPRDVYRQLLASAAPTRPGGRKIINFLRDQVIVGKDGAPLYRIRHQQDEIALLLSTDKTSAKKLAAIKRAIEHILIASETEVVSS